MGNDPFGETSASLFTRRQTAAAAFCATHTALVVVSTTKRKASAAVTLPSDHDDHDALPYFATVDDIPSEFFKQHVQLYGTVERVIDGDTLRITHCPFTTSCNDDDDETTQLPISKRTLKVRLYGIDTPETAKSPHQTAQPYATQARDYVSQSLIGNNHRGVVRITLLRKDQYSRAIVALEYDDHDSKKDLSLELASRGLAELYTGGGAVYNGRRGELEAVIEQAVKHKRGIWSLNNRVSAQQAKRCIKSGASDYNDCTSP